ncbi:MAG: DUF342 domain-containing protein [Clostridium sp.]|uniref:DUF342 domain-containing protein n=1 Tax=Clostridium sp. TaxID=1506 RepID=UPI0025B93433|nr:flagellar assembly protein A [Clostridium sp.]MCF0147941.1 DUF342 domain-containing protein [Clostridium sp.]
MSENEIITNENGSVRVKENKIIVKNPIGNGNFPIIVPPLKEGLYINGEVVTRPSKVKEEDVIEFREVKTEYERSIEINYSKNKMEAYISIKCKGAKKYILKDMDEVYSLSLEVIEEEGEAPPNITKEDLIFELKKMKISYGVDEEAINQIITMQEAENLLIARGKLPTPPIEDKINIFFNNNNRDYEETEKIDYRSFNTITSVKANDLLAEIIKGEKGIDGVNIFNEVIPGKPKKKSNFSAGNGTTLNDNLIIATIDGKPNFSKNKVWVEPQYILNKDVTISTGNINFPANVEINGKVTEGMKVISGGSLLIRGGVFSGEIEAKNSSNILGNIVNSNIKIGGTNLIKNDRINTLKELKEILISLVSNLQYLKSNNLIRDNLSIGLLIKSIIEKKFKGLSKILIKIIANAAKDEAKESDVVKLVKSKLLGSAPSSIKDISELEKILNSIEEELIELERDVIIEANLNMEYAQESKINVVGNINISGRGLFTSELYATKSIVFTTDRVICRGGYLKADELIRASIVGSDSGVITILEVGKHGEIYVDVAYRNTTFVIGNKKYILDKSSKNIHVYIEKDGNLVVDKLLL